MKISSLAVFVLVFGTICPAQHKRKPCDESMSFCWYGDEVDAWGNRWVNADPKKSMEVAIAFRCVKNMGICIEAHAHHIPANGKSLVTAIELLPVKHWDSQQITADAESFDWEPCERDSYIINRDDRSVTLVASPGPKADTDGCMGVLGKPATTIFKLEQ
jgi:hypothetical protein